MLSRGEDSIPASGEWLYEPKWDGFRAVVFIDSDNVRIESRNSQPLLRYFPELREPLRAALPGGGVIDGEIIMPTAHGLDFDVLQNRLHPAESRVNKLAAETPSTFVAFDLLAQGDEDLRPRPLTERREALLANPEPNASVVITPQTADVEVAGDWFSRYEGAGLDGVVAKNPAGTYEPGVRGWVKVKHLRTVDAVVGGYRLDAAGTGVASLLLGLHDNHGVLHYVGHTSSFAAKERRELLAKLEPMKGESFGGGRAPGGVSRWSKGKETNWESVVAELVCEVSFDHMQGDRFRHASRFLRWRPDKAPEECDYSQLQRPADFDLGAIVKSLARR